MALKKRRTSAQKDNNQRFKKVIKEAKKIHKAHPSVRWQYCVSKASKKIK
jgi:hypothetical protein